MHFGGFLGLKITTMDLSLDDIEINPFMITVAKSQMHISTPKDLAEWMVVQWLERSMATSFGSILQSIAKEFAYKKPPKARLPASSKTALRTM